MARELRRLLIDPERLSRRSGASELPLEPAELHYLGKVLRLRCGDRVAVIDGQGGLWQACLGTGAWLESLEPMTASGEPLPVTPRLTLALALPRRDVELVWRMATELGIDALQPLLSERSAIAEHPPERRWQAIVREATEQCERLWLPQLCTPCDAAGWFECPREGLKLLATTRQPLLTPLERLLAAADGDLPAQVTLAIGPEGGWSPAEERLAAAAGWQPVSLGGLILRSATAAISGAGRLAAWRELSCASCRGPSPGIPPDPPSPGDDADGQLRG